MTLIVPQDEAILWAWVVKKDRRVSLLGPMRKDKGNLGFLELLV